MTRPSRRLTVKHVELILDHLLEAIRQPAWSSHLAQTSQTRQLNFRVALAGIEKLASARLAPILLALRLRRIRQADRALRNRAAFRSSAHPKSGGLFRRLAMHPYSGSTLRESVLRPIGRCRF
jgi:hypothetical protein